MTLAEFAPARALPAPAVRTAVARRRSTRVLGLLVCVGVLGFVMLCSLAIGSKPVSFGEVVQSFVAFDGSNDHLVVRELRLPRTLVGVLVGAALGMAGALMQAITRNPLADPGLLGVNAGAATMIPCALFGALLTISADLVARRILAPTELPVGIMTAILGAPYLLWLLTREIRTGAM